MKKIKKNESGIWVIAAVEGEFDHPNANICYTGIGKVNAAIATQHIIDTEKPELVLLLGTVGSSVFDYGQIVNPTGWVQRDMNTTEFFAPKYVVPMTDDEQIFKYGHRDDRYPVSICGSGDTFVRNIAADIWDCVDMEGFAVAYACRKANVAFRSYKFISDGNSADTQDHEWAETLVTAKNALHKIYEEIENQNGK